jgi:hypothetical protein
MGWPKYKLSRDCVIWFQSISHTSSLPVRCGSKNIHQLTSDGKCIRIIPLSDFSTITDTPWLVRFKENNNRFMLTFYCTGKLLVCEIDWNHILHRRHTVVIDNFSFTRRWSESSVVKSGFKFSDLSTCCRIDPWYSTVKYNNVLIFYVRNPSHNFTYKSDRLSSPYSHDTDCDGNIYIIGYGSNNIHQLISDFNCWYRNISIRNSKE